MSTSTVGVDELDARADRIAETAATLDAATHRLLSDIRRFDDEEGWARPGMLSCAYWLNWRCGISLGAAREKVRVAHALAALPVLDEALRLGQVSYAKARAATRVASAENEAKRVEMARRSTAAQLEKICRLYRQIQPRAPGRDQPARWLRARDTDDGMVRIEIQLRPEEAARVLKACDASAESRPDGMVAIAETVLRGDHPDRPPNEVVVHVDAATLEGHTEDTGIPAEVSRRLLCDAGVVPVLADGQGMPLDVGRKTRTISAPLRRALLARDGGCRFPGCTRRRYLDAHHVHHWTDGGETSLANTCMMCSAHHRLVHEGGFRLFADGDGLRFMSPTGTELTAAGRPDAVPAPPRQITQLPTVWDGDPVDYGAAMECLM